MNSLWKAEPTMILAVVSAGIALAIGFGAPITTQQMGLIMAFVAAVLGLINRSQVTSAATLQNMTPKTLADAQDTAQPVKDVVKKLPVVLLALVLAGSSFGCTTARHVAVVADATFAHAVFDVDDVEFQGCQTGALEPAFCAAANPKIKQALVDVKAVTAALQATPNALPKNIPSLIGNLTDVQAMLASLPQSASKSDLVLKIQEAMRFAVAVLTALAGAH